MTKSYWINTSWPGRLAIVLRPRGGDWLEDEVRAWDRVDLGAMISLLTEGEVTEFDLARESEVCQRYGIEFVEFPFPDRGVPKSREATLALVTKLHKILATGKNIGIHCRQGIGRSALIAACILIMGGEDANSAFRLVSAARGLTVPETIEQQEWVIAFARELLAPAQA